MSIVYDCAGCQKRFKVADTSAGTRVKCKECGAIGTVPAAAAAASVGVGTTLSSGGGAAPAAIPPPPPPPPPNRAEEDDDIFSSMADLESSGRANEDDAYNMAPPPPPPPGGGTAVGGPGGAGAYVAHAPPTLPRHVAPVAVPWVPGFLSWLDFNKPFHRIVLMAAFAVMIVGGLVLAAFAYGLASKHSYFNEVAQETEAKLVGRAERHDIRKRRRRDIEAYDIKYQFTLDGKAYDGEEDQVEVDDFPPDVDPRVAFEQQDATITVYYDPENPSDNRVTLANTPFDWVLVAIGVIAVPAGAFGGWRVWRYDRYARSIGT